MYKNIILIWSLLSYFTGNLAFLKPAYQSTTYNDWSASRATDGVLRGANADILYAHTDVDDNAPWWMVDLGSVHPVSEILLYGRLTHCEFQATESITKLISYATCIPIEQSWGKVHVALRTQMLAPMGDDVDDAVAVKLFLWKHWVTCPLLYKPFWCDVIVIAASVFITTLSLSWTLTLFIIIAISA